MNIVKNIKVLTKIIIYDKLYCVVIQLYHSRFTTNKQL